MPSWLWGDHHPLSFCFLVGIIPWDDRGAWARRSWNVSLKGMAWWESLPGASPMSVSSAESPQEPPEVENKRGYNFCFIDQDSG